MLYNTCASTHDMMGHIILLTYLHIIMSCAQITCATTIRDTLYSEHQLEIYNLFQTCATSEYYNNTVVCRQTNVTFSV